MISKMIVNTSFLFKAYSQHKKVNRKIRILNIILHVLFQILRNLSFIVSQLRLLHWSAPVDDRFHFP